MEEIFDKIKVHANKAKGEAVKITKQVADKTNNLISQTKLNFALNETTDKINEIYAEIGKKVYERFIDGRDVYDNTEEYCEKITSLKEEEKDLRDKLAELKDSIKCSACGSFNKKTAAYCSKCGAELNEDSKDYEVPLYEYDEENVVTIKPKKPEENDEE